MKVESRYIVTKGSACGTLKKGDHISVYSDGTVGCVEVGGWLSKEDAKIVMAEVEHKPDIDYYSRIMADVRENCGQCDDRSI